VRCHFHNTSTILKGYFMADANPVSAGVKSDSGKPRNTGRPVRAGLIIEKPVEKPVEKEFKDEGEPRKRGPYKKKTAAEAKREVNFKGGVKE
jgi:hypothetical protein